jgi:cyclic pyranopterin phosphate synthase
VHERASHPAGRLAPLVDPQGRQLRYLRLSVTDRCNLRCGYCMPPAGAPLAPRAEILTWEELTRLCRLCVALGVDKIRLTGGEPLVRRGLLDFLASLRRLPGSVRLGITTNGTLLRPLLPDLARLGLRTLNVSLDSLRRDVYARITGLDALPEVLTALAAAEAAGLALKLNVVLLPGVNEHEIGDFVALTREHDWTVRFIEPMPVAGAAVPPTRLISGREILAAIRRSHAVQPVTGQNAPATAALYRIPDHRGQIGIIHARTRAFCASCCRLRLSARGELRTCLFGEPAVNLLPLLRAGRSAGGSIPGSSARGPRGIDETALIAAIRGAVAARSPDGHAAAAGREEPLGRTMAGIGG